MRNRILFLVSLILLLLFILIAWPDDKYRIVFCDVGQGDGILISHKNNQMLIDTGSSNRKMLHCLANHVTFWDKKIETVVISHWDEDHAGGLTEIAKLYKIDAVYSSNPPEKQFEQINYSGNLAKNDLFKFGLINFEILSPEENDVSGGTDNNEKSVVGLLSYKDKKFLLTGDAPLDVEDRIVWRTLQNRNDNKIDVLKVSHHGSDTATGEELIETVRPQMAIISVGRNNKFGLPKNEVVDRLKSFGVVIKRTDESGDLVFELD